MNDLRPPEVLCGVDLSLAPGETIAIVGPNGAGKSTLLETLTGTLRPDVGRVTLGGRDVAGMAPRERARRIAVVPQAASFPAGFDVGTLVAMGRNPHVGPFGRVTSIDEAVVAAALARTDTEHLTRRVASELSGGERQRVVLARALAQDPAWFLFDEPTNHLDLRYQAEVLHHVHALAREGRGVVWVVHDLNLAARCARVIVLDGGAVVADGRPRDVLTSSLLSTVFETALDVRAGGEDGAPPRVDLAT